MTDPKATSLGLTVDEFTLCPGDGGRLSQTRFDDWLRQLNRES